MDKSWINAAPFYDDGYLEIIQFFSSFLSSLYGLFLPF